MSDGCRTGGRPGRLAHRQMPRNVLDRRPHMDMAAPSEARSLRNAVASLLSDPRDMPFLILSASATLVVIPFAIALFIPGVFHWWLAVAYLLVNGLGFLDRFILMLHNTSHRTLFKPRYRLLNLYIPWVLGPFFGE